MVEVLIANKTNCVKDRAYIRLLGSNCRITIVSGLSGDYRRTLGEIRRVANGGLAFCGRSLYSLRTIREIFTGSGFSTIVRFTKLGTINRSIRVPLTCCRGGVKDAVGLYGAVTGRNYGGLIFDSSTAICNSPRAIPVARSFPLRYAGPCNEAGLVVRRVLHSLCISSGR